MTIVAVERTDQAQARKDLFHEKQFLLVGGADSKLHVYRLRLKEEQTTGENQLSATNFTRRLFGDLKNTVMFNAPVQAIYNSFRSKSFIAASALGQLKVFSYKDSMMLTKSAKEEHTKQSCSEIGCGRDEFTVTNFDMDSSCH